MRLLLHTCCAWCLGKALAGLRAEFGAGLRPQVFFFNPNIHPLIEFRRRLKAVKMYAERDELELIADETYGLTEFCAAVQPDYAPPARCAKCYDLRLTRGVREAAARGATHFSTTLFTSPHQDHAAIRAAGERALATPGANLEFIVRDWRKAEPPAKLMTGLYRQQYCGCVFSEAERFAPTSLHLYPPVTGAEGTLEGQGG